MAAAVTVSASEAECVRLPDVPVNVTVEALAGEVRPVVSITFCGVPGVRLNVAGFAVVPAGSPVIATIIGSLNPLTAFAVTLTAEAAAPAVTLSDVGDRASV